jgi:uncharacterized protein
VEKLLIFIRENVRLLLGIVVVIFITAIFMTLIYNIKTPRAIINGQAFKIQVVTEDKDKQIGLSNKNHLSSSQGMLFIFAKPDFYSFWMKDMKFPIDIIYINNNKVTTIIKNAPIPSSTNNNLTIYKPTSVSDKVLEINAGLSDKYNIQEGTSIKIENL